MKTEYKIIPPPCPPPGRTMRDTVFCGLVETNQSKERTKLWRAFTAGYRRGSGDGISFDDFVKEMYKDE